MAQPAPIAPHAEIVVSCLQMGAYLQFTDRATVTGFRKTADGYLVGEAFVARSGIQVYGGHEVGRSDLQTVRVYRSADEVKSPDSVRTYSHAPITLGHPPEMVTADNFTKYAKGEVSTEATWDGNKIKLPLIVKDAETIRQIVDGGVRELSAGYLCDLDWTGGKTADGQEYDAEQVDIRINHVAVVPAGRAGPECRIGDNAQSWGASPVTVSDKGGDMPELRKIMVDGLQVETTDAGAAAIEKLTKTISDMAAKVKSAEEEEEKAKAKMDAAIAAKDAAEAAKITPAMLDAMVTARVDLIGKAKAIVADFDAAGKSDADIRKAVVAAKLGDAAIAGKTEAYVDARFDILAEDAGKADPFKDAKPAQNKDNSLAAVYAARDERLKNAWKGEAL